MALVERMQIGASHPARRWHRGLLGRSILPILLLLTPAPAAERASFDDEASRSTSAIAMRAGSAYAAGYTGKGVRVAVLDTGVNTRLFEFRGRVVGGGPKAFDRRRDDSHGHGTQVASVILAARDGILMHGVAPEASLLTFDVVNGERCGRRPCDPDGTVARAIDEAVAERARIINISGTIVGDVPLTLAAVRRASAAGVLIVVAAGNQGLPRPRDSSLAIARAGDGSVIVAGGHDLERRLFAKSNRAGDGARWYLMALGDRVSSVGRDGYFYWTDGTSLAAAAISGAAALVMQCHPEATGRSVAQMLFTNADQDQGTFPDAVVGHGALRIDRLFAGGPRPNALIAAGAGSQCSFPPPRFSE